MHYPRRSTVILEPQNARERLIYQRGYYSARRDRGGILIVHGVIIVVTAGLIFMNTFLPHLLP